MAAIRDWSYNYHSTTTIYTITVPLPKYAEGDLLLAILSTDTGTTQVWSSTGWTQLFSVSNTSNLGVMYKIAGASETDPTFTYTIAETANGALFSIRDFDASSIFADYDTANISTAREAMPVSVAARANSLVIYCWNNAVTATALPSAIEGPVTQFTSKDGSAHNDGIAWTFQASAGNTPSDVYITTTAAAYVGVKASIVINPPAAGASVIPAYCASDSSIYVDPIHGISAFRGNTAFAGTALTYWTTPLAGRTLANATASAKTDYGINTFRSCGGMTGPTAANTYTGATTVLLDANRPNVTGKNVLVHAMPLIPADIQTVYDAGLGKGIEVGMASSLDNGIVWHVHGFGTPWGVKRVPIVINEANTSGRIDTRGTFDKTLTKIFGFFTCGFLVSSDWTWTMIWVLDTTVVAGGNASEPVKIEGIITAVADGHERISALIQGKDQMLLLQPIQIGNGGTNPVYLDLNATAIEFPEIYNLSKKQIYYCSVENVAGITYYAGASDTIKHRNSIISSPSRYKWGLHASSSTSATYDFSGLSVIGAGTISLANAVTITGLTINNYSTINASSLTLNSSTITNVPSGNDSITINSSTAFNSCSINVTGVTAGNRLLSTATPNKFTGCTFTGSASTGHAMMLTVEAAGGTFAMVGNTFTSFDANGTTSAAIYNNSGGAVTLNISGGGNTPTIKNGAGASTIVNNVVTVKVTVKDAVSLAVIENARVLMEAETGGDLPAGDSVTIANSGTTATVTHTSHGLVTGNQVIIRGASLDQNNGVFTITLDGGDPTNKYTYTMDSAPGSNPTGSITSTSVILFGTTTAGILQTTTFNFTNPQPITGKVRRATTALGTKYKTGAITGTITSAGLDTTVLLIADE